MISRALLLALGLTAFAAGPMAAQETGAAVLDEFRPLPLHEIARQVSERYDGRLLAAETRPPRSDERDRGVALIYEFRLLTPRRQMLNIRVDARSGRFLEVAGRGQIEALRRPGPAKGDD